MGIGRLRSGLAALGILAAVSAALVVTTELPAAAPAGAVERHLAIATGSRGGTYFPVGEILAKHFNAALGNRGFRWSARLSGGTAENLELLKKGDAAMAIAMANLTGFAATGTVRYQGNRIPNLRYVLGLWPDVTQFVCRADAKIKTWSDLRGKRVAVGPPGSGTEFSSGVLLQALAGLSWGDIVPVRLGYDEGAQALREGRIDAFNAEAGIPTKAVAELLETSEEVTFLEFSEEDMARLAAAAPFYARVVIPEGTYPGQAEPLGVAGIRSALLADEGLPENVVYDMLTVIYARKEAMAKEHAAFTKVDYDNPLAGLYGAPLHPGAVRFFTEKGVRIPPELLP